MALDPQIQALMNASPAPATAPAPAVTADSDGAPASGLDPQIQALMNVKSAPAQASAPADDGGIVGKFKRFANMDINGPSQSALAAVTGTGLSAAGGIASLPWDVGYPLGLLKTRPDSIIKKFQSYGYQPTNPSAQAFDSKVLGLPGKVSHAVGDALQNYGTIDPDTMQPMPFTPAMAGAVEGGLNAAPLLLGDELPSIRPNELNIGMGVGKGGPGFTAKGNLTQPDVLAALQKQGVKVKSSLVQQSGTELNAVVRTARPLTADQANAVATDLGQGAIVQRGPGGNGLYGPQAKDWGGYNPGLFLDQRGQPVGPMNPTVNPLLTTAATRGVKLTPDQVSGINGGGNLVGRAIQSLSHSAKLERSNSKFNAKQVDADINAQIGVPPGVQATPKALNQAAAGPNAVYAEASRVGNVDLSQIDPTLKPFIEDVRRQLRFPDSDLSALDAGDLITTVRELRAQGFANKSASRYSPSQKLQGQNQIAAANALDDALDTHIRNSQAQPPQGLPTGLQNWANIQGAEAKYMAGKYGWPGARDRNITPAERAEVRAQLGLPADAQVTAPSAVAQPPQPQAPVAPDLMPRLLQARQQLAQIASARRALRPGGHYFAGSFAKQLGNNVPLQGAMRDFGELYGSADRSFQDVNKIRDSGPLSVLDLLAGASGLGLEHFVPHALPVTIGYAASKPLGRVLLGSKAYQARLTGGAPGGSVIPLSPAQLAMRRALRGSPALPPMSPDAVQANGQ